MFLNKNNSSLMAFLFLDYLWMDGQNLCTALWEVAHGGMGWPRGNPSLPAAEAAFLLTSLGLPSLLSTTMFPLPSPDGEGFEGMACLRATVPWKPTHHLNLELLTAVLSSYHFPLFPLGCRRSCEQPALLVGPVSYTHLTLPTKA